MNVLANTLVTIVAIMHFGFMFLEMFLWTKPTGMRVFRNTLQKAQDTAVLAANQGLYNGFLAAGLVFGLLHPEEVFSYQLKIFFLLCVAVAGLYGAYSVSRRILYIQALPAILALIALY